MAKVNVLVENVSLGECLVTLVTFVYFLARVTRMHMAYQLYLVFEGLCAYATTLLGAYFWRLFLVKCRRDSVRKFCFLIIYYFSHFSLFEYKRKKLELLRHKDKEHYFFSSPFFLINFFLKRS